MLIGWAKEDLTYTRANLKLAGHHSPRNSVGILDHIYATAVLLSDTVICSVDYINVPDGLKNALTCDKNLILIATHNHSSYDWDLATEAYKRYAISQCQAAIDGCIENAEDGEIAYGFSQLSIACQKRIVYANQNPADEKGMKYVDKSHASFSYYDGGVDEKASCIFTFVNDELNGILLNIPCPAQCGEWLPQLSADFWADVRTEVSEEFGDNVFVLPMCGPAGEVTPELLRYDKAEERKARLLFGVTFDSSVAERDHNSEDYLKRIQCSRRIIGKQIIDAVKDTYSWCSNDRISDDFIYGSQQFSIGALDYERHMGWGEEDVLDETNSTLIQLYNGTYDVQEPYHTVDSQVVTLSNSSVAFVFTGFEIYTNYALRIQEMRISHFVVTSQLAGVNGSGYLADNLDNTAYQGKEDRLLGYVGAQVYCRMAKDCIRKSLFSDPSMFQTMPYEENSMLNDLPLRVTPIQKPMQVEKQQDGSYKINCQGTLPYTSMYKLYDLFELNLNNSAVLLDAGTYKVFGCQIKLLSDDGTETFIYGYRDDKYTPDWVQFTVEEPTLVSRIGLYAISGAEFNDYVITPKFEKVVIE